MMSKTNRDESAHDRPGFLARVRMLWRGFRLVWHSARSEAELRKQEFRDRLEQIHRDEEAGGRRG